MTNQEAVRFLEISKDYLPEDKLKDFINRLDSEFITNNPFRQSLNMVKILLEPPIPKPKWCLPAFYVLIITHFILICGVGLSFFLLPFMAPWYIALPLMTFIWFFGTTKVECKLTEAENYLRRELGMKQIGGFVGHYFRRPAKRLWKKYITKYGK